MIALTEVTPGACAAATRGCRGSATCRGVCTAGREESAPRAARVADVVAVGTRASLVTLDFEGAAFAFVAGQAVRVSAADQPQGPVYSIACSPEQAAATGRIRLLTRPRHRRPRMMEEWRPGNRVSVALLPGGFNLPAEWPADGGVFVAGGTGIAPIWSIIDHVVRTGPTPVALLYSVASPGDLAFRDELHALDAHGRLRLLVIVTRAGAPSDRHQRLRRDLHHLVHARPGALCIACGPPSMVAAVTSEYVACGGSPADIRTDSSGTRLV